MSSPITVTVVVPTHNRHRQLEDCLASLARQDFPNDRFEVIVVDDGSEPQVSLHAASAKLGENLKILSQENLGPSSARNTGARAARGKFLLFTDDDCEPRPGWTKLMVETLERHPESVVGGQTVNALKGNVFAQASQLLNSYIYEYYNEKGKKPRFFASNNLGLSKNQFYEVGGFSTHHTTHYSEDRDFCDRLSRLGKEMIYVPKAIIEHSHQLGFFSFMRQHFHYGTGARSFHLERKQRNLEPPAIEPPRFYLRMFAFPYQEEGFLIASVLAMLVVLTQVAHTFGYFWQRFWIEKGNIQMGSAR